MSRVLFVRVSANTYDEAEVPRTWPVMYATVWPDASLAGVDSPAKLARKLIPAAERGVLELADAFIQHFHFGDLPTGGSKTLGADVARLEGLRQDLNDALGNRDVPATQRACDALETCLDDLEKDLRGLKGA